MEIGFREWLIVGAIIVILLIIIDGWRRMRAQSNSLKIDIDDKLSDLGEDTYNPELPLGTARVFKPKPKDNEQKNRSTNSDKSEEKERTKTSAQPPISGANAAQNKVDTKTFVKNSHASVEAKSLLPSVPEEQANGSRVLSNTDNNNDDPNLIAANSKIDNYPTSDESFSEEITSKSHPSTKVNPAEVALTLREAPAAVTSLEKTQTTDDAIIDKTINRDSAPTINIGFSALEPITDSLADPGNPEVDKELFTVPDILKKDNSGKYDITQNSHISSNVNVEELLVPKTEDLSISSAEIGTNSSEGLEAATENTDNIVNNLLHSLALSKQQAVDKTACPELAISDNLEQSQEPNVAASTDIRLDKFEQLLAQREQEGFVSELAPTPAAVQQQNEQPSSYTPIEQLQQELKAAVDEPLSISSVVKVENSYEADDVAVSDSDINGFDEYKAGVNATPIEVIEQARENTYNSENSDTSYDSQKYETVDLSSPVPNYNDAGIPSDLQNSAAVIPVDDHLSEIEILKARLKELAPQEFIQLEQPAEFNELTVVKNENSFKASFDIEAQKIPTADQQAADKLTTVIDDDVSLEDLNSEMAIHQLDSSNSGFADSIELPIAQVASQFDIDQNADPLMDGFQNSIATNDLMSQFEDDLKRDEQAVANELDLPITEIIKKNKVVPAEFSAVDEAKVETLTPTHIDHSQAKNSQENRFEMDPLLDNNKLSESVLSGDNFDDDDQQSTVHSNAEHSVDEGDNLGFTALEQGYDNDPLMAGFEEQETRSKEGLLKSNEKELLDQEQTLNDEINQARDDASRQESLFTESKVTDSIQKKPIAAKKPRKAISNVEDPNTVLIVTVAAKDQYLNGAVLRHLVEACGMEFGDMNVFHRFEDGADQGAVQFSMANGVNPGTFNIESMDDTATPSVSFFMSMDEPIDPKKAFECMIATAETVATHLNGDLLDDDRSVIRPQTKEHYRERVRIHEMNKLRHRVL
ncbi:MAG: cell division protein ZipA [Oceanospirillaceae bacterium]